MKAGWIVYILECADGTLYTGITLDLPRRLSEHMRGVASKYTRARLPVAVLHHEPHRSHSSALRREASLKKLPREAKWDVIDLARRPPSKSSRSRSRRRASPG